MSDRGTNFNPDFLKPVDPIFDLLIYSYFDGTQSSRDAAVLKSYLKDPRYISYFVHRCKQEQVMYDLICSNVQQPEASCSFELDVWQEFAKYEDQAPAVPFKRIAEPAPVENLLPVKVRRINKTSLITILISTAALLLMIAYVNLFPSVDSEPVATIVDAIHAQWENSNNPGVGQRLFTRDGLLSLKQGVVKIQFDNGAHVILESPGKFELIAPDQIYLQHGKLFAQVPKRAIGFTVKTQTAKVIDLGTEFGVDAIVDGSTELHVYKGKTTLIAGTTQGDKQLVEVAAGRAKRIRLMDSQISDISLKKNLFIREIDSIKQLIWKGEPLSLISLVTGGNGFTEGNILKGIDPNTGGTNTPAVQAWNRLGNQKYHPVVNQVGIDGVFVPNGNQVNVVTSKGHIFDGFPKTDNSYWADITTDVRGVDLYTGGKAKTIDNLSLRDMAFGRNAAHHALLVHPNTGITFDLSQIRKLLPLGENIRFTTVCGVSDNEMHAQSKSESWILVDGQCKFHYQANGPSSDPMKVNIIIEPSQQYLTLATTDGGDLSNYDWCLFADPVIELVSLE